MLIGRTEQPLFDDADLLPQLDDLDPVGVNHLDRGIAEHPSRVEASVAVSRPVQPPSYFDEPVGVEPDGLSRTQLAAYLAAFILLMALGATAAVFVFHARFPQIVTRVDGVAAYVMAVFAS